MSWVSRWAAKCDECGKEWIPEKDPQEYGDPKQCAKCKTRRWNHGNDEGAAKGSVRPNHGQYGAADAGGATNLRVADEKAGRLSSTGPKHGGKGVRDMRRGVRDGNEGQTGDTSTGATCGPYGSAQPESGTMGGGSQENPELERIRKERALRMAKW